MTRRIYSRLALTGMRKNKRLYLPYLCTAAGMVMMFFILAALADSEVVRSMPTGASSTGIILRLGMIVVGLFALIFLFYTNSLLIRRRHKEFGLYNVLGMNKAKLCRILFWETLFSFLAALIPGVAAGVLFSKLAELLLARSAFASVSYSFALTPSAFTFTVPVFALIFLLLMLFSFARVRLSKPMDLMKSETVGEKPPRANWPLALVGLLLLGGAYYLAVTITDPVAAITLFFVAVLMVIVGTYLLFIAASVALCRLLQKKKGYYYKARHFVSVSSMAYRMKRNGAGLASVCILATMVLVMLSSTGCLFLGAEDSLRRAYPYDFSATLYYSGGAHPDAEDMDRVESEALRLAAGREKDLIRYRLFNVYGSLAADGSLGVENGTPRRSFYLMPLEDYNGIFHTDLTLAPGEALLFDPKGDYPADVLRLGDLVSLRIAGTLERTIIERPDEEAEGMSWYFMALPEADWCAWIDAVWNEEATELSFSFSTPQQTLAFDLTDTDTEEEMHNGVLKELSALSWGDEHVYYGVSSINYARAGYYALYGTFFFLGVLLSIVFLVAAALIIYYKQLSEGFEDQSRFDIMQKVGMTKKEIRSTVNSQVLTVFFAPLVLACVHLAFAFPMISKMLILFGIVNSQLLLLISLGCAVLFALFYVLIYRLTARAYYAIVSA